MKQKTPNVVRFSFLFVYVGFLFGLLFMSTEILPEMIVA